MNYPYRAIQFDHGLRTILVPMEGTKSVTVLAMVGTGSRFEDSKTNGISHFLEHMVFKGTKNFPTARELASAIDEVGAEFNAFTSKEYTGYYVKCASSFVDLASDVVSDMLLTARLLPADIEREKGVIVEEIHMYEDTPMRHIGDCFEKLIFDGSPLGWNIIGTESSVRSFTQDDFVHHLNTWYGFHNVVLVVAGDASVLNQKGFEHKLEHFFSKDEHTRTTKPTSAYIEQLKDNPFNKRKRLSVHFKESAQAHFILGFPGLKRTDERRYALTILSTLLGGNMSSRLFTEVREKRGLCYYVRSDEDHYHDCGVFGASAGVDPSRVDEAVKVVYEQLLLLASDGEHSITHDEVKKAKSHVLGATTLDLEDSMSIAHLFAGSALLQNKVETIEEKLKRLENVTFEQVREVAKQLIDPPNLYFSILGPYQEEARFERLLD
ncbi:hypothetical protein C5B42_03800 [Candidatus Cerribacteria bacterium 'Amazon FNV 2010 28 9']|uniref:Peptidase M16 n=1 Tax=Candidatus Cerribacteria bacterium 'Amazon FNV 2010 28 9' TaxID=2081795 RepID=A0A317JR16_9BACT|nr:MAG: hypothetical protein C5B42_03800 [Candidatus Cerribacteria bacterium 'Amazon FNV 2010 28 9']